MGSEDYVDYEQNIEDDTANNNGFREYGMDETKIQKNAFKKRMAQAKRLLVNKASKEYSQVHEQQEQKSVSKMLVSVSKINDLKGKNCTHATYFIFSWDVNMSHYKTCFKLNISHSWSIDISYMRTRGKESYKTRIRSFLFENV